MEEEEYHEEESITELLIRKEKELQALGKLRIQQLQEQLSVKDQALSELHEKVRRMNDDFQYNLQIIEQRDEELDVYDRSLKSLQEELGKKDRIIAELSGKVERVDSRLREEVEQVKLSEKMLLESRDELRRQLQETRRSKDDELRRREEEATDYRTKMEATLASKHKEYTDTLAELQRKFEDRIARQLQHATTTERHTELQRKVQSLETELRTVTHTYTTQLETMQRELDGKEGEVDDLQMKVKRLQTQHSAAVADKPVETAKIAELQAERMRLQGEVSELKRGSAVELSEMTELHRRTVADLTQKYNHTVHRLQKQLTEAAEECRRGTATIKELEASLEAQEAIYLDKLGQLQTQVSSLDRSWKEASSQLQVKEAECESVLKHVDYWRGQAESTADEVLRLKSEVAAEQRNAKRTEETLRKASLEHTRQVSILQSDLQSRQTDYEAESRVRVLELENARLQAESKNYSRPDTAEVPRLSPDYRRSRRDSVSVKDCDLYELTEVKSRQRIRKLETANASLEKELTRKPVEHRDARELMELKDREIHNLKSQ
jgi:chromosome segregation ATPase